MARSAGRHRAFLLRVWTGEQDESLRSSVRDVESGETRVFANLDHLNDWLRQAMNHPLSPTTTHPADVNYPGSSGPSDQPETPEGRSR